MQGIHKSLCFGAAVYHEWFDGIRDRLYFGLMDRNGRGLIAQTRQIRQTCNHIQILSAPPEEGEESDPTLNDERNDGYGKPVIIIIVSWVWGFLEEPRSSRVNRPANRDLCCWSWPQLYVTAGRNERSTGIRPATDSRASGSALVYRSQITVDWDGWEPVNHIHNRPGLMEHRRWRSGMGVGVWSFHWSA